MTERDRDLLCTLFKNKVLSSEQVQKYLFCRTSKPVVFRRLNQLYNAGWVEKKPFQDGSKRLRIAYGILPKGLDLIRCDLPYEVRNKQFVSDSILHDLSLVDIAKVFERFAVVSQVFTESELLSVPEFLDRPRFRPFVSLRSDRLLVLRNEQAASYVALEYERVMKSSQRIKLKFEEYYLNRGVSAVLYVCENQSMVKSLMKIDEDLCQKSKSKIYFCTVDEIHQADQEIIFRNNEGGKLTFRD